MLSKFNRCGGGGGLHKLSKCNRPGGGGGVHKYVTFSFNLYLSTVF